MPTLIRPSQINLVPVGNSLGSLLKADNTETTVTNTAVDTTFYNFTIPAGTLKANDGLRITAYLSMLQNSGAAQAWTFRLKLGGTTIASFQLNSITAGGTTTGGMLEAMIKNTGVTNSQKGTLVESGSVGTPAASGFGTSAIDMTAAQSLVLSVQFAAATATQTLISLFTELFYMPAT